MANSYLIHVTTRIVGMFELYTRQIDPNDAEFQDFIKRFLQARESMSPENIPYSKLYTIIREGIDAYLRTREAAAGMNKE